MTTEELKNKIAALLGDNEELALYRKNRERDASEPWLPNYHFRCPGGYLNDPSGYCYFKGIYHLFYQFVPEHTGLLGWGHAVSTDKIHWFDLPAAVMPTIEICCGSGGTVVDGDRAVLCYQGDLADHPGGAIHVMESRDELLLHWERVSALPSITTLDENGNKNPYNAFDPCIWKTGDLFYLLSAGGGSLPHPEGLQHPDFRKFYLFTSRDLVHWDFLHSFVKDDRFADLGDDGACPYFLPIGNGKHILLHFSHKSGGKYIIGRYDRTEEFFYAENGDSFNVHSFYSGVHAPSAFSCGDGSVSCIFNMNYGTDRGRVQQIMSLPRRMTLGDGNTLREAPDGDYTSLRYDPVSAENVTVPANRETVLPNVSGKSLEIDITADILKKTEGSNIMVPDNLLPVFEVRVLRSPDLQEYTSIRFYRNRGRMNWEVYREIAPKWATASESVLEVDTSHSTVCAEASVHPTEYQSFMQDAGAPVHLHIFVDKSIVEVYSDGERCTAVRTYPILDDSSTVSVICRGVDASVSYTVWKMGKAW